jgi:CheY-like chemotaxis protein
MEEEFAVILLDVNMPDMDGFETATMIHQHPRFEKTPIIFVSAVNVSDLDRLRGYKLGAVGLRDGADHPGDPAQQGDGAGRAVPQAQRAAGAELQPRGRQRRAGRRQRGAAGEKAREVHKLNQSLTATNIDLARSNRSLQIEILERRNVEERLRRPTGARTSSWPRSRTSCATRWRRSRARSTCAGLATTARKTNCRK